MEFETIEEVHVYLPEPTSAEIQTIFGVKTDNDDDPFSRENRIELANEESELKLEPDFAADIVDENLQVRNPVKDDEKIEVETKLEDIPRNDDTNVNSVSFLCQKQIEEVQLLQSQVEDVSDGPVATSNLGKEAKASEIAVTISTLNSTSCVLQDSTTALVSQSGAQIQNEAFQNKSHHSVETAREVEDTTATAQSSPTTSITALPVVSEKVNQSGAQIQNEAFQNQSHHSLEAAREVTDTTATAQSSPTTSITALPAVSKKVSQVGAQNQNEAFQNHSHVLPSHSRRAAREAAADITATAQSSPTTSITAPAVSKKVLICDDCDVVFNDERPFLAHRKLHVLRNNQCTVHNLIFCAHCEASFQRKGDLIPHLKKHVNHMVLFSCTDCGRNFTSKITLWSHRSTHTKIENPFVCADCHQKFEFKTDLLVHIIRMHSANKSSAKNCPLCRKKFPGSRWAKLKEHLARKHIHEKFYKCGECFYTCITLAQLATHVLDNHTEGTLFKCKQCDAQFPKSCMLAKHKKVHLSDNERTKKRMKRTIVHKCKVCSKIFSRKRYLRRHFLRFHAKKLTSDYYICAYCESHYANKDSLRRHIIMKHLGLQIDSFKRKSKCKLCKKVLLRTSMYSHNATCHQQKKRYVCERCGAEFARSDYLQKHMFKHSKERAHLCSYCAVKFSRKDNLKAHEMKHALQGDKMKPRPPVWKRP